MSEISTKLPVFDGNEKSFSMWRIRFRAYAMLKGFGEALAYDDTTDMSANENEVHTNLNDNDPAVKEQGRKGMMNFQAVAALSMALSTEELISKVHESSDQNWPGGKAYKIMNLLLEEYRPTDRYSMVEIRRKLNKVSIKENQDPKSLFEQLAGISNEASSSGVNVSEEEMIAIILDRAPISYAHVLATIQNVKGRNLSLNDLKEAMRNQYRIVQGRNDEDEDENEMGLSSHHHKGKRKPKGTFRGKCHHCGKIGHKKQDCYHLAKNKDKRPKGFQVKQFGLGGSEANDKEDSKEEFLLTSCTKVIDEMMKFPSDSKILNDPNVWIADTGATCDSTPHKSGFTKEKKAQKGDKITIAKAKQKNVPKVSEHIPHKESNGRIYLDISTVKKPKNIEVNVTKRNWCIMVDEKTGLKSSLFTETKDGMVDKACKRFNMWKQDGKEVKIVRCDDAGENKKLEETANGKEWQLNIKFEYTGRSTPQRNHLAELAFATLSKKGVALMVRAHVPIKTRYTVWREAFQTVTDLDGLQAISINGLNQTRYQHFDGKLPAFVNYLRTWGEAGTVKIKSKTTPKLADKGVQCMFVGYAHKHGGDVYRMWNPNTNRVHISRDVIWLKRMYFKPMQDSDEDDVGDKEIAFHRDHNTKSANIQGNSDVIDSNLGNELQGSNDNEVNSEDESEDEESVEEDGSLSKDNNAILNPIEQGSANENVTMQTRSGRAVRAPSRLIEEIGAIHLTKAEREYYKIDNPYQNYYQVLAEATEMEFAEGEMEFRCRNRRRF